MHSGLPRTSHALFLIALSGVPVVLHTGCGPEFETCEARRSCPRAGEAGAGGTGQAGAGGSGSAGGAGGAPDSAAAGGGGAGAGGNEGTTGGDGSGAVSGAGADGGEGGDCRVGERDCDGTCIAESACCHSGDCGVGKTCAGGACVCSDGLKRCGAVCIAESSCCDAADCTSGAATCGAGNTCVCSANYFGAACNYYFKGLGFAATTHDAAEVNGVSGNGAIVVGWSKGNLTKQLASRWVAEVGRTLPAVSGGLDSTATAVNSDGSVIAGDSSVSVGGGSTTVVAFRWTSDVSTPLELLPLSSESHATAISADGSVIVGWGDSDGVGLRWTNGAVDGIRSVVWPTSMPMAVSANGQVLLVNEGSDVPPLRSVGTLHYDMVGSGFQPARWVNGISTPFELPDRAVTASNSDGTIAAGYGDAQAIRWTDGVESRLGDGAAYAISGDGSVVVGSSNNQAMIWDATHGPRLLSTVLAQAGVSLTGWTLRVATGISSNGKVIVGNGTHGTLREPWIVRLP